MTIAEALEDRAITKVAKNMLKEGADNEFVVKTTQLAPTKIEELIKQLD